MPGRGRSYLAVGTPRLQSVCASRGGREGGQGTCRPRPWPFCARRGGREDTGQAARPGCGLSAQAGAGEKLPGRWDAPAAVGLREPGREGGHLAGGTPRLWPFCASRGGGELPGCWDVPAATGPLEGGGQGTCMPRLQPFYTSRGGGEDTMQAAHPPCTARGSG